MERYVPKKPRIFYVYEHWRPDKNQPFYVGKGKGKRAFHFHRGHNLHYTNIVKRLTKLGLQVGVVIPLAGVTGVELRGRGGWGRSPTKKTRKKISKTLTGRSRPIEVVMKVSAAFAAKRAAKFAALQAQTF
jgi:hypothetical protein